MLARYKPYLISLFAKVQELNANPQNATLCLEIQEALIRRITYVERRIRQIRPRINNNKRRLRTSQPRLSKEEAAEIKADIEYCHYLIEQYQSLLVIFRNIGDAVAFTYIDKWNIKPLAFKQAPGFISGKEGVRLERKILRSSFALGIIVILNDITNCLRYGDITVPKHGQFMLLEAKSGKPGVLSERGQRQLEEARSITRYLDTDRTEELYKKKGLVVRAAFQSKERNHIGKLNRILAAAYAEGHSYVKAEEGLYYYAATRFDEKSLNAIAKRCNNQPLVVYLNFIDNTAYYPFTLSIRDPRALFDFYKGRLNILVLANPMAIRQICSARGFDVEFLNDEDWALKFTHNGQPDHDEHSFKIGHHIFGRIFAEFLSLEWFLIEMMNTSHIDPSVIIDSDNT